MRKATAVHINDKTFFTNACSPNRRKALSEAYDEYIKAVRAEGASEETEAEAKAKFYFNASNIVFRNSDVDIDFFKDGDFEESELLEVVQYFLKVHPIQLLV